jgi:hypothetical protein
MMSHAILLLVKLVVTHNYKTYDHNLEFMDENVSKWVKHCDKFLWLFCFWKSDRLCLGRMSCHVS